MDIILHNYPQSPVAEKIRVALGIKGLAWRSVEIPRLPPKPMLTRLTGGYRRTPVMQIGADIFCDSQCIARELERRFPEPSLFADAGGDLSWGLSRWTDTALFEHAIKIVLGAAGDALPRDFAEDRGRLYLGPDWAAGLDRAQADLRHLAAQMRAQLGWVEAGLDGENRYLLGNRPGFADCLVYHVVWFLRGRWRDGPAFLAQFPRLCSWEKAVEALGHGTVAPLTAQQAIEIAAGSVPRTPRSTDPADPQGLTPGLEVEVAPDLDGGEQPVRGTVRFADRFTVALDRQDEQAGNLCVHLPRAGYRIRAL